LSDEWELTYFGDFNEGPHDDYDGDGLDNLGELQHLTDPTDPDTDSDGMPDGWEVQYGLDPLNDSDANGDIDGDGFTNLEEYQAGADPTEFDTSCCSKPTLQTPSGEPPAYQWSCGFGEWSWFWVYVQNLSTGAYYGSGWVNSPDPSWTSALTLPWGSYRAWVRVYHESCGLSEWSDPVDFTVGNCSGTPILQTPSGEPPTYQWDGGTGEWTWFWVYVQNLSTGAYYGSGWVNSPDSFWTSALTLPVGSYRAWVRVYHESCGFSEWSDPVDWTVGGGPTTLGGPLMLP